MRDPTIITLIFFLVYFLWSVYVQNRLTNVLSGLEKSLDELNELEKAEDRLNTILELEKNQLDSIGKEVDSLIRKTTVSKSPFVQYSKQWEEPIPVLVFACNRPNSIRVHLEKLIKLRPSKEKFPITVSQDCDDADVASEIEKFGDEINYVKHTSGIDSKMEISQKFHKWKPYFYISRHYKLALTHIFSKSNYSTVIITEDDLDIAPDFFSFFSNTRYLLEVDPTLYCVTAWNDNGKLEHIDWNAKTKLYRSDFFAGLGWMMTRKTWKEFESIWPKGFWDDWMREPAQRKGRQCIRPEVSRTGMMKYGKIGVSKGLFFTKHLSKIKVNDVFIDFSQIDLDYLLPKNYKFTMKREIDNAVLGDLTNITSSSWKPGEQNGTVKIVYTGKTDFVDKGKALGIMTDLKSGVPRTAFDGVVTCFYRKIRLFLIPDRSKIPNYDPTW